MENDPASPLVGSAIKRKLNSLLLVHESAPLGSAAKAAHFQGLCYPRRFQS